MFRIYIKKQIFGHWKSDILLFYDITFVTNDSWKVDFLLNISFYADPEPNIEQNPGKQRILGKPAVVRGFCSQKKIERLRQQKVNRELQEKQIPQIALLLSNLVEYLIEVLHIGYSET
jgi:hypothetical protein